MTNPISEGSREAAKLTHSELVNAAAKWAKNTLGCSVAFAELDGSSLTQETPDVIAWQAGRSILIECKASRADFLADRRKLARREDMRALGQFRFYFAVPGIIKPEELPRGWSLYEYDGRKVNHAGGLRWANGVSPQLESCKESEVRILLSALRRMKAPIRFNELAATHAKETGE